MAEYKLTYFPLGAFAEPIRWIFKYVKVPFEDERISLEDWPNQMGRFPLEKLPVLTEKDGRQLTQCAPILRYLAKKYGLITGDDFLDYRIDEVTNIVDDGRQQWRDALMAQGPREEIQKIFIQNQTPKVNIDLKKLLTQLESIVGETNGDYITGDKVTYGDFVLANWLTIWQKSRTENLLEDYPNLTRQLEAVITIPQIKQWISERPLSPI